jgi:malate dehydrogenase (oxaloacetate-decarboxylating)(NADP+)
MSQDIYNQSLHYHRKKPYGKLAVVATKAMDTREDLMLAYSPGVAQPCRVIEQNPQEAAHLTARGNLVAVITNGTAVLGLGDIGPLAAKPVMEGKAVLFKKFAGIDSFDIEINQKDPDKFIETVAALEPTFGGINLEDIKSPECFYIERELANRMNIPVFHDDQHGTAIIVCAALRNALTLVHKDMSTLNIVCNGAGAAALACLNLMCAMGARRENIVMLDRSGVVRADRSGLDEFKAAYATTRDLNTLDEAMAGADMFMGLSVAGVVTPAMVASMAAKPLIFALANPEPEITPAQVKTVREDAICATGRSDYPNQVNNVLCFPFLFRGALDVGATHINLPMKIAAIEAIARIARAESSDIVSTAYGGEIHQFGADYIIPKPFDPRLFVEVSREVARAAIDSGVATRPFENEEAYTAQLEDFIYRSSSVMRTVFKQAKAPTSTPLHLVFSEGESRRVLQTTQMLVDEKMCQPVLIGRPDVIQMRLERLGLRFTLGQDVDVVDPNADERYQLYWRTYYKLAQRKGVTPEVAKLHVRTRPTIIGGLMLHLGDADAMLCGTVGRYHKHFEYLLSVLGQPAERCATLSALVVGGAPLFMADTQLNANPSVEELVRIVRLCTEQVRRFGIEPKVALVSHSNFGSSSLDSAVKMRAVLEKLLGEGVDFEVEGEMHADAAILPKVRERIFPDARLTGSANVLIAPTVESANIAFNLAKALGGHLAIGPMLLGLGSVSHIVTPSISTRGLFNMAALAIAEAKEKQSVRT